MTLDQERPARTGARRLSYGVFAIVVIVYLVIIQAGGLLVTHAAGVNSDHGFVSTHNVLISLWVPTGAALVFTYAVVASLRWWRPVLRDNRPIQRWVWVVPIVFAVAIVLGTDYRSLADKGLGFTLVLLIGTQFVGGARKACSAASGSPCCASTACVKVRSRCGPA